MSEEPRELNHLQRYLVEEFVEDYEHGQLSRRDALKMIAGVMGTLMGAEALLAACTPPTEAPAQGPTVAAAPPPTAAPTRAATAAPSAAPAAASAVPATAAASAAPTRAATVAASAAPAGAASATAPAPSMTPAQAAQVTRAATQAVVTTTATAAATPAPTVPAGVRVAPDDPAITAAAVQFPGQGGASLMGYLARPKGDQPAPMVLVCHENRGLTDHIRDVARRAAKAGYVALAVDLLSRQGGTDKITDQTTIPGLLSGQTPEQMVGDFASGLQYLQAQPFANKDRAGMVGFCFGGGITWMCATGIPQLRAAVPFYGPNPPLDQVPKIQAAVLAMYGELDQRIDAGIPAIEQAMQANNKIFQKMIYPGANHAFHNDTGANYQPQAAMDAWAKTIAWFDKYLKA